MYDAVPSESQTGTSMALDPEMEKFLPMLRDYLKSGYSPLPHDKIARSLADAPVNNMDTPAAAPKPAESVTVVGEDDYVWDVFYSRPADGLELSKLSQNIGTV